MRSTLPPVSPPPGVPLEESPPDMLTPPPLAAGVGIEGVVPDRGEVLLPGELLLLLLAPPMAREAPPFRVMPPPDPPRAVVSPALTATPPPFPVSPTPTPREIPPAEAPLASPVLTTTAPLGAPAVEMGEEVKSVEEEERGEGVVGPVVKEMVPLGPLSPADPVEMATPPLLLCVEGPVESVSVPESLP